MTLPLPQSNLKQNPPNQQQSAIRQTQDSHTPRPRTRSASAHLSRGAAAADPDDDAAATPLATTPQQVQRPGVDSTNLPVASPRRRARSTTERTAATLDATPLPQLGTPSASRPSQAGRVKPRPGLSNRTTILHRPRAVASAEWLNRARGDIPEWVPDLPDGACIRIHFDGGSREGEAAIGVYVSDTCYLSIHIGPGTCQVAEIRAATEALVMLVWILRKNSSKTLTIDVVGDCHGVVSGLAARAEMLYAVPGRSVAPALWAAMFDLRMEIDDILRTGKPSIIAFIWVPRRFNAHADEAATAALQRRPPTFTALPPPLSLPTTFSGPTETDCEAIARAALSGAFVCWRSIPTSLRTLWHAILGKVASWGPWALYLAPVVLLRRATDAPSKRLQQLALSDDLVAQYYWNAAHSAAEDAPATEHKPEDAASRLLKVERRAAHAPAAALRILNGTPPSSPEDAAASLQQKFAPRDGPPLTTLQTTAKPAWVHAETIKSVVGRLARAAAPGADGWTRETLLASFHITVAPAWELLVNAIVTGKVPAGPLAALIRGGRLAAWPKTGGHRIIGMSSAVAKACWKAVIAQHLRCRSLHPCVATYARGGSSAVLRWTQSLDHVYCADIADAFWSVSRREVASALELQNSPAAHMFTFIYGTSPIVVHGTRQYKSDFGLIPGCGGAAFAFAVALSGRLDKTELTPEHLAIFADDTASCAPEHIAVLEAALAPDMKLCKKRSTAAGPIKLFGSFIGPGAAPLAHTWLNEKCAALATVAATPLSCQARFALLNSVERSIRWFVMVTPPSLISDAYGQIDEAIIKAAMILAPRDATPTRRTSTLLFLSSASGGGGFISYGAHGHRLYDAAATPWPPVPVEVSSDGIICNGRTWKEMRETIDEIQLETARDVLCDAYLSATQDATVPWYNIARITKYETIRDEDWSLFWAHTIGMNVPYATCEICELAWDHIHSCPACGAAFKTARHDRVVAALNSAARRYGVVSSMDFFSHFGAANHEDRPDIVFYRTTDDKVPLVIDVTIRHQAQSRPGRNNVEEGSKAKIRKYAEWFPNEVEFKPMAFSSAAHMPKASLDVLSEVGRYALSGFVMHAIRRIKCAIIASAALRRRVLLAKNGSHPRPTVVPTSQSLAPPFPSLPSSPLP